MRRLGAGVRSVGRVQLRERAMAPHQVQLMRYCASETDRLLLDGESGEVNGRTGSEEVG